MKKSILDSLKEKEPSYRIQFFEKKEEIFEALQAGYSLKKVWQEINELDENFGMSYDMFVRYCRNEFPELKKKKQQAKNEDKKKTIVEEKNNKNNVEKKEVKPIKKTIQQQEIQSFAEMFEESKNCKPEDIY